MIASAEATSGLAATASMLRTIAVPAGSARVVCANTSTLVTAGIDADIRHRLSHVADVGAKRHAGALRRVQVVLDELV